jgi:hypothetical protein
VLSVGQCIGLSIDTPTQVTSAIDLLRASKTEDYGLYKGELKERLSPRSGTAVVRYVKLSACTAGTRAIRASPGVPLRLSVMLQLSKSMLVRFLCDVPCGFWHLLENEGLSVYLFHSRSTMRVLVYLIGILKSIGKSDFVALCLSKVRYMYHK